MKYNLDYDLYRPTAITIICIVNGLYALSAFFWFVVFLVAVLGATQNPATLAELQALLGENTKQILLAVTLFYIPVFILHPISLIGMWIMRRWGLILYTITNVCLLGLLILIQAQLGLVSAVVSAASILLPWFYFMEFGDAEDFAPRTEAKPSIEQLTRPRRGSAVNGW